MRPRGCLIGWCVTGVGPMGIAVQVAGERVTVVSALGIDCAMDGEVGVSRLGVGSAVATMGAGLP